MTAPNLAPRNANCDSVERTIITAFEKFSGMQDWPEELAHLKGKKLRRKRDGEIYRISQPSGQCIGRKPAAYLAPAGCSWTARSHWKTYAKILTDFEVIA